MLLQFARKCCLEQNRHFSPMTSSMTKNSGLYHTVMHLCIFEMLLSVTLEEKIICDLLQDCISKHSFFCLRISMIKVTDSKSSHNIFSTAREIFFKKWLHQILQPLKKSESQPLFIFYGYALLSHKCFKQLWQKFKCWPWKMW